MSQITQTAQLDTSNWPSVNALTNPLVEQLLSNAKELRLGVERSVNGATIIDAGIDYDGGLEAGRLIAEICMGGLGHVSLQTSTTFSHWPWMLSVHSNNPILSCLGSQYAGWSLAHEKFFSLGSGPGRALAGREDLFKELGYKDQSNSACLVLESDKAPPIEVIEKVSRDTGVSIENLTFILTPTRSLAGTVQIVARVLEVAMHKIHTLHFPLDHVVDGMASAPVPPPSPDFLTGMGRTNDAVALAKALPSNSSRDFGRPFAEVFKSVNMDFYKIDPMLFSPAAVTVTALESGNTFTGGALDAALIDQSFGFSA